MRRSTESLAFHCGTEMINRSLNDLSIVGHVRMMFLDHCQQQQVCTFLRIRIRCYLRSSGYCWKKPADISLCLQNMTILINK